MAAKMEAQARKPKQACLACPLEAFDTSLVKDVVRSLKKVPMQKAQA